MFGHKQYILFSIKQFSFSSTPYYLCQEEGKNGQNNKVGTTSKICDFVKLAGASHEKE